MHVPVLLKEVIEALQPHAGGVYLDGTLGSGGYSQAILEASQPNGLVVGLDMDLEAVTNAKERLKNYSDRFRAVHGGFQDATRILKEMEIEWLDGVVLDLGLSSEQLENPERGFSFKLPGPLDMRFDTTKGKSALEYIQSLSTRQLEEVLATYGDERYYKKLARGIISVRDSGRLKTTKDLADVVSKIIGNRRGKIHPATRTFQALRIAVNRELENLKTALDEIPEFLKPGARFCVVSYHSLEDREVKQSFSKRQKQSDRWRVLCSKPIRPSQEEVKINPRARSAKMRILEARPT